MIKIALTGSIACGKSLVGEMLKGNGMPVCEADTIGHTVLLQDELVKAALIGEFGGGIVGPDGQIDRTLLGQEAFADPEKLKTLNRLTHPAILKRLDSWLAEQGSASAWATAIVPLLYEAGLEKRWDVVICVGAPEADQLRRLTERGVSLEEARARIGAQMSQAEKMERADYVIYNCGSKLLLEKQVKQVLRGIRGE